MIYNTKLKFQNKIEKKKNLLQNIMNNGFE